MATWTAIVPAKRRDDAKSRLGATRSTHARSDLALAFITDALAAIAACPQIARVIVVTDDDGVADVARRIGAQVVAEPDPGGLNRAITAGAHAATGPVIAIAGDLPALTAAALVRVLDLGDAHPRSFLCDAAGTGTAMLLAHDPAALQPEFGPASRARHATNGFAELGLDPADAALLAGARRDVDTEVDLWDAVRIGVGPSTREALATEQ